MPITETGWFVEKRVVLQILSGQLTGADLIESRRQVDTFAIQGTPPVHLISDASGVVRFPLDFRAMREAYGGKTQWQPGWAVIVSANPILPTFISRLMPVLRTRMRMVRTRADAARLLEQLDPSLKGLLDDKLVVPGR